MRITIPAARAISSMRATSPLSTALQSEYSLSHAATRYHRVEFPSLMWGGLPMRGKMCRGARENKGRRSRGAVDVQRMFHAVGARLPRPGVKTSLYRMALHLRTLLSLNAAAQVEVPEDTGRDHTRQGRQSSPISASSAVLGVAARPST